MEDAPVEQIREATRRALENLVELCLAEQVRFVVIAGDVFDGDWPDYSTGLYFSACMARLCRAGINVFLVSGNHDAESRISRRLTLPEGVFVFPVDRPATCVLDDVAAAVHGMGFREPQVTDNVVPRYPDPVPGCFNIGVLHTSLEGQEGHVPYAPCRLSDLLAKGYDYWALGHIHKRMVLHESPYVVYPGNLQGRHVRETGAKGCTLVTVNGRTATLEHRPLDVIRWVVCVVDLTGAASDADFFSRVAAAVQGAAGDSELPLALRVRLTGLTALHGRILADPERYRHEVANAVLSLSDPGRIWLEAVRFDTRAEAPIASRSVADAVGSFLATAEQLTADEQFLAEFLEHVQGVQRHIAACVARPDATRVESLADVRSLLPDARELVLDSLRAGGGGQ